MLLKGMNKLTRKARKYLRQNRDGADPHRDVCVMLADEFELWEGKDEKQSFPLWLSRVVEGEMRDLNIGQLF